MDHDCAKCLQPIASRGVEVNGMTYHHRCAPKSHPCACLAFGTRVSFVRKGRTVTGFTRARHLNPARRPGIGRVTYDVAVEVDGLSSGYVVRDVPARSLTIC